MESMKFSFRRHDTWINQKLELDLTRVFKVSPPTNILFWPYLWATNIYVMGYVGVLRP